MPGEQSKYEAVNFIKKGTFEADEFMSLSNEAKNLVTLFCRKHQNCGQKLNQNLTKSQEALEAKRSSILQSYAKKNIK